MDLLHFLDNPSESSLEEIVDKDGAIKILKRLPHTTEKLLFLWNRDDPDVTLLDLVSVALRENKKDLIHDTIVDVLDYYLLPEAKIAAVNNRSEELYYLINMSEESNINLYDYDDGLNYWDEIAISATKGGNLEIVQDMIEKSSNAIDIVVYYAAKGGHKEIIDYLINYDSDTIDYNMIAKAAAVGGHRNIVNSMIRRGATNCESIALSAAFGGHRAILHDMIELGVSNYSAMIRMALDGGQEILARELSQVINNGY